MMKFVLGAMVTLIMFYPSVASSQAPSSVGAHVGISNSWLYVTSKQFPDAPNTWPSVIGYNAMVESEWIVNKFVHIQIGIGYAERGFRRDFDLVTFFRYDEDRIDKRIVGVESILDYANLQLNAKIIYPIGRFSPYVWLGPRYDVLVSRSDENIRFKFDGEPVEFSVDYTPLFDDTFWGITYGGGITYNLTTKLRMSMDIGYVYEIGSSVGNNPNFQQSIRGVDTRIGLSYLLEK